MRFSAPIVSTLMVSVAIATPVIVYETKVERHTVVVGPGAGSVPSPVPSPVVPQVEAAAVSPSAAQGPHHGNHHGHHRHGNGNGKNHNKVVTVTSVAKPAGAPPAPPPPPPPPAAPVQSTTLKAVAASPSAQPAADSGTGDASLSSYESTILSVHNQERALHSASPLTWNDTLAAFAQNYLNNQNCVFDHSGGPYGENIALGYSSPTAAIEAWYNEESDYNYAAGQFGEDTGHFTQIVWKDTKQLGCAQVACSGQEFFACEYYPAGNVIGEFVQNVVAN